MLKQKVKMQYYPHHQKIEVLRLLQCSQNRDNTSNSDNSGGKARNTLV
jgi:hypothetical protein